MVDIVNNLRLLLVFFVVVNKASLNVIAFIKSLIRRLHDNINWVSKDKSCNKTVPYRLNFMSTSTLKHQFRWHIHWNGSDVMLT